MNALRRPLLTIILGGVAVLAVLATVSDPAWDWRAIGAALWRWTVTVLTVFTITLFVSLCALGWANVFLALRRNWRARRQTRSWLDQARSRAGDEP